MDVQTFQVARLVITPILQSKGNFLQPQCLESTNKEIKKRKKIDRQLTQRFMWFNNSILVLNSILAKFTNRETPLCLRGFYTYIYHTSLLVFEILIHGCSKHQITNQEISTLKDISVHCL